MKGTDHYSIWSIRLNNLIVIGCGLLACLLFLHFDSLTILDKDTYISIIEKFRVGNLASMVFTFNGIELISALVLFFLSILPFSAEVCLAILIFCYTTLFFSFFKNQNFIFLCFVIIIFGLYLVDLWLNQIKLSIGITLLFYTFVRLPESRAIKLILGPLAHIQLVIFSVLMMFDLSKLRNVLLIFAIFLVAFYQIDWLIKGDLAVSEKLRYYLYSDGRATSQSVSILVSVKVIIFGLLATTHILVFKKYGLPEVVLVTTVIVFLSFIDVPSIAGRLNSVSIFFEPFVIARHNKYIKSLYIIILVLGAFMKWA